MHVLACTTQTQGDRPDDLFDAIDGELATFPTNECPDHLCHCTPHNRFVGLGSRLEATTVQVVDRPDLDPRRLGRLLVDHLGEVFRSEPRITFDDLCEWAMDDLDGLGRLASAYRPGTVLGRRGERPVVRRKAGHLRPVDPATGEDGPAR
jgi:hypothetical protein